MATSQQFLVCDASTLANFKQWASAISGWFATAGWTQSTDTGQVNWSTISTVPGSNTYVYEIWEPNDGLTNFFVKVEYGNVNTANAPAMRLSLGSSTNGAGTLTGFFTGTQRTSIGSITPPSTSTQYECDFSGAPGRMAVMLWRNAPNADNCTQVFAIERSVNSGGTYTSSYVTLYTAGGNSFQSICQNSLLLGVGPTVPNTINDAETGFAIRSLAFGNNSGSTSFNGGIPMDLATPVVGFFDYYGTSIGVACALDIAEGVTFTATVYGSTRTYMPSKNGTLLDCGPGRSVGANTAGFALCMRYD
jgi:hypothetical protein